jgi:hypothetical protein
VMLDSARLGLVAGQWDGAAQRLVDANAALRGLARRAAAAIDQIDPPLAAELRSLAGTPDPSLRLSALSAANDALRAALARLGVLLEGRDEPPLRALRAALLDELGRQTGGLSLLGPRADG